MKDMSAVSKIKSEAKGNKRSKYSQKKLSTLKEEEEEYDSGSEKGGNDFGGSLRSGDARKKKTKKSTFIPQFSKDE